MMMVMPATYVTPGEVVAFGMPKAGFFDLGRYPSGNDATVAAICAALDGAGFAAFPSDRVMDSKYAKLILNLGNVLDAAVGEQKGLMELAAPVLAEGRAVLTAAGIAFSDVGPDTERRKQFTQMQPGTRRRADRLVLGAEPRAGRRLDRDRLPQWRDRAARPAAWRADTAQRQAGRPGRVARRGTPTAGQPVARRGRGGAAIPPDGEQPGIDERAAAGTK